MVNCSGIVSCRKLHSCTALVVVEWGCRQRAGASQMATSSVQSSQQAAEGDSGDDAMHAPDDSESEWGSVSDGLVGEEEMAGVEDLWMEHLQCVHTHGRHKYVSSLFHVPDTSSF